MFSAGPTSLLILAGIVLLLFGSRLPSVARSLGLSIVEFKKGVKGIEDQAGDEDRQKNSEDAEK